MKKARLGIYFIALGLVASSALTTRRTGAQIAPPPTGQPQYIKTTFALHPLNPQTGAVGAATDTKEFFLPLTGGYSFVRHFTVGSNAYALLLSAQSGKAVIYRLEAGGQLGEAAQTISSANQLRCTAADFALAGGNPYLITHDSFTGKVRAFPVLANGQLNLVGMIENTAGNWKDKSLCAAFAYGGHWRLLGLDTWTGKATLSNLAGQEAEGGTWTRGWTDVDHLSVGATTYRLLYKAAGDPHQNAAEEANDASYKPGRLLIQKLSGNVFDQQQETYDNVFLPGWSAVRFLRLLGNQGEHHAIFRYNRQTGEYRVSDFDSQAGTPSALVAAQGNMGPGWTDVEPCAISKSAYLLTLNEEGVEPFYFDEAEKMAYAIHAGLATKAVGYQFMLAQSGRVLYSRAWGKLKLGPASNDEPDTPAQISMTSRDRLDLGSVSKVITGVTALKLAEMGEVDLYAPITNHLYSGEYPANSWATGKSVFNLLTHTTGMRAEDDVEDQCKQVADTDDDPKATCYAFFAASPTVPCNADGCARTYNNANISAVRQVIEYVTNIETTTQIVAKTRNLWADSVNLGGITCNTDANYYFGRCNGADDCYDYNGASWKQVIEPDKVSGNCAAGGWRASSREMIEFLAAIRYRKALGEGTTSLFLNTNLKDAYQGATAVAWEPPWDALPGDGEDRQLGKNGKNPKGSAAMLAYITRLPNNADAVLLVNTNVPGIDSLVQGAYRYGKGLSDDPPIYIDYVAEGANVAGDISRLALNTLAGTAHVTAVGDGSGNLKLIRWDVESDGEITRGGEAAAGLVSEVAITDGEAFVTAVRASGGVLKVIAWASPVDSPDDVTRYGDATGVSASKIAVTKLAGSGTAQGRVVTAARNASGNLRLDVWDFNNQTEQVTLKDTWVTDPVSNAAIPVSEIAVETLYYKASLDQTARFVTAARRSDDGKLQVDVWDVDGGGQIERKGSFAYNTVTVSNAAASTSKIAFGKWGNVLKQSNPNFFIAFLNGDGELRVATFATDEAGVPTQKDYDYSSGESSEVAVTGTTTAVRDSDGNLSLIYWSIDPTTGLIKGRQGRSSEAISKVAAAGNVLTALRLSDGTLKLIKWKLV